MEPVVTTSNRPCYGNGAYFFEPLTVIIMLSLVGGSLGSKQVVPRPKVPGPGTFDDSREDAEGCSTTDPSRFRSFEIFDSV